MEDEFLAELQDDFLTEVTELLEQSENFFLELENNPDDKSLIQKIFRLAHNIKGSAGAVQFYNLSTFAHHVEELLVALNTDKLSATPEIIDILLESNDTLKKFIEALKGNKSANLDTADLVSRIEKVQQGVGEAPSPGTAEEKPPQTSVEKMVPAVPREEEMGVVEDKKPVEPFKFDEVEEEQEEDEEKTKIGEILVEEGGVDPELLAEALALQKRKVGEILVEKKAVEPETLERALEKQKEINKEQTSGAGGVKKTEEYIRLPLTKIENLLNSFGEQVILQSSLEHYRNDIAGHAQEINKTVMQLSKITHDLQQTAISLRMVSMSSLFKKMLRIVRDGAKSLNKEIKFHVNGENTELDKSIIDELSSPLTHLIRNSVDHGVEDPDTREQAGKPRIGNITMSASYSGRYFYLEIKDDGQGLDKKRIYEKAVEKGLIQAGAELTDSQILDLIFLSGFSTKDVATDMSGRGVGMDAIRKTIEKLRGTMELKSEKGQGTSVVIKLPPTLAIFNGIVVEVYGQKYIVPSSEVQDIYNIDLGDLHDVGEGENIIKVKETLYSVINLRNYLNKRPGNDEEPTVMLTVHYDGHHYGILVDKILVQQRIVFKNLGQEIDGMPGIAGGTILGDGLVALILELSDIIDLYREGRRG